MSIAEIIDAHSRRLPEQAAREALSYIEFLEQRYAVPSATDVAQDATEAFLAAVARLSTYEDILALPEHLWSASRLWA